MHRFHSQRALNRLKFGSFLYLVFIIAAIALFPAAFWVILLNHTEDTLYLLISLGTAVLSGILCLVTSIGVRCPLCHGPLLANPQ